MIKLNDNNIFVGYIKQLLKEFNLPNCYIGRDNASKNNFYIENNILYKKLEDDSPPLYLDSYNYDFPYEGLTTNLEIRNILYDRYTHRYLGRYLQFLRAYKNIDLMSMYNCFDQEIIDEGIYDLISETDSDQIITSFGKTNDNYVTYKIPINKLNSGFFSFYIQTKFPIEVIVGIENYFEPNQPFYPFKLIHETYKKLNIFNKYLLDIKTILKNNPDIQTAKSSNFNIYLLIKIPKNLKSKVVILDGDYITNKIIIDLDNYNKYRKSNLSNDDNYRYAIDYNVNPQLKNYFNDDNYLLADKLISYLTGNAITSMSEYYDITKVQDYFLTNKKPYVSSLDKSNTLYDEASFVASENKELQKLYNDVLGSWSEADTEAVKQTMLNYIFDKYTDKNLSLNFCPTYFDRLPYVDNDIEILMHKHMTVYEEKQLTGEANG